MFGLNFLNPIFSLPFGWLFGRRQRRSAVVTLMLVVSLLACGSGCMMSTIVAYLTWNQARAAAALPRPTPAELRALAPGTQVLLNARLPENRPVGSIVLALFYIERQSQSNPNDRSTPPASEWQMDTPPPARVEMMLDDGSTLSVQLPQAVSFLNSHKIESGPNSDGITYRYVGYLPGQALTLHGRWEGNGLLTAQALYAGSAQDYLAYLSSQPGNSFLMGLVCGGIGIGLFLLGLILRLLGK